MADRTGLAAWLRAGSGATEQPLSCQWNISHCHVHRPDGSGFIVQCSCFFFVFLEKSRTRSCIINAVMVLLRKTNLQASWLRMLAFQVKPLYLSELSWSKQAQCCPSNLQGKKKRDGWRDGQVSAVVFINVLEIQNNTDAHNKYISCISQTIILFNKYIYNYKIIYIKWFAWSCDEHISPTTTVPTGATSWCLESIYSDYV